MPFVQDCPHDFKVSLETSFLRELFIFWTIIQPGILSSEIPAAAKGLFTKNPPSEFVSHDAFR